MRPDHLRPHARRCSRKKRGRCTWARKGGALRSECLIEGTERQTWLACVSVLPDASDLANKALRRVLRLGCVVCHAYRRNMVQNTENGDGSGLDKGRSAVDQNVFGRFAQPLSLLFRRGALWSCRKHSKTRIHQEALQAWHANQPAWPRLGRILRRLWKACARAAARAMAEEAATRQP